MNKHIQDKLKEFDKYKTRRFAGEVIITTEDDNLVGMEEIKQDIQKALEYIYQKGVDDFVHYSYQRNYGLDVSSYSSTVSADKKLFLSLQNGDKDE